MRKLLVLAIFCVASPRSNAFNLTEQFGNFSSPGYPAPYPDNVNQSWRISVPKGFRVVLYFTAFELEDSFDGEPCAYDYVEVDMGENQTTRFCGNPRFFPDDAPQLVKSQLRSRGNTMQVRMVTDYSNKLIGTSLDNELLTGFRAHYFKEDINECSENRAETRCDHFCNNYPGAFYCSCRSGYKLHNDGKTCVGDCAGVFVNEPSGEISSPGFPGFYPSLTDCSWKIKTDAGKRIEVEFGTEFAIEDHFRVPCPYDFLKIYDSSGQVGPTFCGNSPPFNGSMIRSTTNWLQIKFHSDSVTELSGFQFSYRSREIQCDLPPPPAHGHILHVDDNGVEQETPEGSIPFSGLIVFECDDGFRLVGSGKIACLKDGSLSDRVPLCVPF